MIIAASSIAAGSSGFIPIPFVDLPIVASTLIGEILGIAEMFGYDKNSITFADLKAILKGGKYSHDGKAKSGSYINAGAVAMTGVSLVGFSLQTGGPLGKFITEVIGKNILSHLGNGAKFIPVFGTFVGTAIGVTTNTYTVSSPGVKARNYFESKFKAFNGNDFFISRIINYKSIFRQIKELTEYNFS